MALLECCRLLLYLIEWIWTTVVLGIFPSQLKKDAPTVDGTTEGICLFNMNVGQSRCNYGMAWAAVAFVVLTVTIIWYALEYCSSIQLPGNVETTIFIWLSLWWFIGSVTLTATKSGRAPPAANAAVAFAWMLFIFSVASAYIGSRGPKPFEYRTSETQRSYEP